MSNLIREIPVEDWAELLFSKKFHKSTLYGWCRGDVIVPKPRKVGGCWMVKENAEYIPPATQTSSSDIDPVVIGILG